MQFFRSMERTLCHDAGMSNLPIATDMTRRRNVVRRPSLAARAVTSCALVGSLFGWSTPGFAAACGTAELGDGHVAEIIDGRSFRLTDGREIRLAGIETSGLANAAQERNRALGALIGERDIILRGHDDAPDRYGRQSAFAFVGGGERPVQAELLAQGMAIGAADITEKECAVLLSQAEGEARRAGRGIWGGAVIKNAESPDDILAGIGRFTVVEGKVLSVRQAGATTYLNFGRNWTRGFAVTISRRMMPAFEAAGLAVKTLENQRVRVRGWVEARAGANPGPRIDVARVAQIEILNSN